jgi:hypothetical protein
LMLDTNHVRQRSQALDEKEEPTGRIDKALADLLHNWLRASS